MLIPYRLNTLTIRPPWANLIILALNVIAFAMLLGGKIPENILDKMVLTDWSLSGLFGSQFLHVGIGHIVGNMVYLWVFGNALNGVMHDHDYVFTYLGCGVLAGALHLLIDGHPAVGASGAISGLLGLYLAVYPTNEITCFYWFFGVGSFDIKGYIWIIGWFIWDVVSAVRGVEGIASWAHVGGTVAGFLIGIILLKMQRIYLGEYDHATVLDFLPQKREKS